MNIDQSQSFELLYNFDESEDKNMKIVWRQMVFNTKTESNLNKMLRVTICVFVLCNLRSSVFGQLLPDDDTVDLVQGTLRGSSRILDGRRVYYFLGVPYAEPPLSNRRFRPSSPHNGWTVK